MIRNSKSLLSLFFLLICFLSITTYIKKIIFDKDLIYSLSSLVNSKKKSCNPKENSLIDYIKKENLKSLIIIIDAYPNNVVYKNITGYDSNLHKYLKSNSEENLNTFTAFKGTQISLPFLLGKIRPNSDCRYPFFRGSFKPKLLLNHELIQSNEGLCPESYKYGTSNRFIKYQTRFLSKVNRKYKENLEKLLHDCSISNINKIDKILKELEQQKSVKVKNRINIAHEFQFHRNARRNITELKLPLYDSKYLKGLTYLINEIKKSKSIDELIIMNDHGPRTDIYGGINSEFVSGSLKDQNFYGVFVYRVNISKFKENKKPLKELIPYSKERYDLRNSTEFIKLEKFIYKE